MGRESRCRLGARSAVPRGLSPTPCQLGFFGESVMYELCDRPSLQQADRSSTLTPSGGYQRKPLPSIHCAPFSGSGSAYHCEYKRTILQSNN
eukprot:scaffold85894_cov67-Phaeocystis_antarctica.AAC.6